MHITFLKNVWLKFFNVNAFLNDLLTKAKPAAIKQLEEVKAFAKKTDNLDSFGKWI